MSKGDFFMAGGGGDKIIINYFILIFNYDNVSLYDFYDEYFRDVVKLIA